MIGAIWKTKSFWVGLASILSSIGGFVGGEIGVEALVAGILGGLGMMTIRHAVAKGGR